MKANYFLIALTMIGSSMLVACNDDDDKKDNINVPETYTQALQAKYPEAKRVKWERKYNYYVAEFSKPQQEYDVWFGNNAQWAMTEIDYGKNLFFLPPAVDATLANSKYGTNYTIDEVKAYERADRTFYIIEVEPMGGGVDEYQIGRAHV